MRYYPILLDLKGKNCLVVGGGQVAWRKIKRLLDCGAKVKVVAREVLPELKEAIDKKNVIYLGKEYKSEFLKDTFLVIGATDDEELNQKLSIEANNINILCNIVDQPEKCNFIVPSVVVRGDLIIAISTSGKSPALAKRLRLRLENEFGEEYAHFLNLLGKIRDIIKKKIPDQKQREIIFSKLVDSELLDYFKKKDLEAIKKYLKKIIPESDSLFGKDF
ncbi:MAG TPA: bifunctional precorrin-2 dehydrogenase/sirohydrochlorin ferrochelatase [Candidatus Desulfofervidus auxilii]|uniref:precorrin-2 dehydrogenase n=1 Tax=Desulfofervidus auxilii TaxID=1621989 RepID=A0A7C0U258_DESA2|nr:bifunctional precorrin-2 dehydrogenase/sirohydrochlorin ferrochelatase [Candidatus Desulfofervidus auxilii]